MLVKIGDVTNKFGISHRSLHYWENTGILQSTRGENDYRYYDEENMQKIKQIVFLRKLRLSIPSIQEIFTSSELSKIISVFTDHLDESKKEKEQLSALGIVLQQLINMLKDRQNKEINIPEPQPVIVDMAGVDLTLEPVMSKEINEATELIKRCYPNIAEIDKLLFYFNLEQQLNMPDCANYFKIVLSGKWIGVINLTYVGREAMLIRCLACMDSDINIYLFEILKQKYPEIMCWNIYLPNDESDKEHYCYDWDGRKKQFLADNGFVFYTGAIWNRYIKMIKPHDEVYNGSKYRFALSDGTMDGVSFRFFGANNLDFYDGKMVGWRITYGDFSEVLIYDTWMGRSRVYDTSVHESDFRYTGFDRSIFVNGSFEDCRIENCNIKGLTIDGTNVEEALKVYKDHT